MIFFATAAPSCAEPCYPVTWLEKANIKTWDDEIVKKINLPLIGCREIVSKVSKESFTLVSMQQDQVWCDKTKACIKTGTPRKTSELPMGPYITNVDASIRKCN